MRKTLVILTPAFPKDEQDDNWLPDRQIFVRVLRDTHPELNIIVVAFQYPLVQGEYYWKGIKVIGLAGKNRGGIYRRLMWLRAWKQLKKINTIYNVIGLLSFWMDECAFIADKFAKSYKLKHYCWILGQDARPGNKYVHRIMPVSERLVTLSDFLTEEFERNYKIRPKYMVPGALDPSMFKPYTGERDIDILGAGSLIPLKQYSIFIDVIHALKKDFPNIKAVLRGNGPEKLMLEQKIEELGLEDNISLIGELPHVEVLALMQRAKIFLHTSSYEGLGTVNIESLYAGAKLISFVKPFHTEITNWNIAKDTADMTQKAKGILLAHDIKYYPVLPYKVGDTAKAILKLFTQDEVAIAPMRFAIASNDKVDLK